MEYIITHDNEIIYNDLENTIAFERGYCAQVDGEKQIVRTRSTPK